MLFQRKRILGLVYIFIDSHPGPWTNVNAMSKEGISEKKKLKWQSIYLSIRLFLSPICSKKKNMASWLFEQFFQSLTSAIGFLSHLNFDISLLIVCFKILSWEDLACWPFQQLLRPLPQIKDGEWLNFFVSYHYLP